jgi:lipoprotein signal peptidase
VPGPFSLQLIYDPSTTFAHVARSSGLLVLLSLLVGGALGWCAHHFASRSFTSGAGLALGGLASNMADGLTHRPHGVVDFITLCNNWVDFNLADLAVVTGVTLALIGVLRAVLSGPGALTRYSSGPGVE